MLIKMGFSKALPKTERRSAVRVSRRERGIWQRRYWEHLIRDEADYRAHLDYIHYNPVKHGWAKQVKDLPKGHKGLTRRSIAGFGKVFIPLIGVAVKEICMSLNNVAFMPQRLRTAMRRTARWLVRLTALRLPRQWLRLDCPD